MSYTPGRWIVYKGAMGMDKGLNPFFRGIVCLLKHSGEDDDIAVILDRDEEAHDYEANARLISAAPELLEALALIHHLLKNTPAMHVGSSWWGLANNALKKAGYQEVQS